MVFDPDSFGLVTASILYRRPDHRFLLQEFVWQDYDLHPEFPALRRFLAFWVANLDGPLHSVTVAHQRLVTPREVRHVSAWLDMQELSGAVT